MVDLIFQTIIKYKLPVKEDGTLGSPVTLSYFTRPVQGTAKAPKKVKPKKNKIDLGSESSGEVEM